MYCISSTSIFQAIYEAHLEKRLEDILLKLLEYNSTPYVQEPIRQFLMAHQIAAESFSTTCKNAHTYEDVLECYHQYAKNQCTTVESLLENLRFTLDKDGTRKELSTMLRDGFTF